MNDPGNFGFALETSEWDRPLAGEVPVSVVMPVHNVSPFVDDAIASILRQSHRELEFLIRDDGSSDGTSEALDRWARRDGRIKVFHGEEQLGPAGSSNWIVRQARHELIARMDGDDVSHPDRLRRQVEVLRARRDVSLVGTLFRTIDLSGRTIRGRDRSRLVKPSRLAPFAHGSIMYRRGAFDLIGGYRSECDFWEDQDFYVRMAHCGTILVLAEPLFDYRFNFTSTRLVSGRDRVERAVDLGQRCLAAYAATGEYEELLAEGPREVVDPSAVISVGNLELWAYRRPSVLPRLLAHDRVDRHALTAWTIAWALLSWLSPGFLRTASRMWVRLRDATAGRRIRDGRSYEWPLSRIEREARSGLDPGALRARAIVPPALAGAELDWSGVRHGVRAKLRRSRDEARVLHPPVPS